MDYEGERLFGKPNPTIKTKYDNYKDFLNSNHWQAMRSKILKRDNNHCRICIHKIATQVHHLFYSTKHWQAERLFNLISICKDCHIKYHKQKQLSKDVIWQLRQQNIKIMKIKVV